MPDPRTQVSAAAGFWDENRHRSLDEQGYWAGNPVCRHFLNRRITGNPHEWPLEWFRRVYLKLPLRHGISWGCGLGAFERDARRFGIVEEIDAFDVSELSLADARREPEALRLGGIHYLVGDFNDPSIPRGKYDSAFFHASLHHVAALERMFRRLAIGLSRLIYVDEYVGPSRFHWQPHHLAAAQQVLDEAPQDAKTASQILLPIEQHDPSEAFRSDEIIGFLRAFCDLVAWRPYGGQVVDVIFPYLKPEWVQSPAGVEFLIKTLEMEDGELAVNPDATHGLVAVGCLKPVRRLVGPLARQAADALRRRAGRSRSPAFSHALAADLLIKR
jgi:Methyltransferase domain